MGRIGLLIIWLVVWGVVMAQEESAQEGAWEFSADSLQYEKTYDTTTAIGNVVLEKQVAGGTQKLQADKVIYNAADNLVTAIGNVEMWDEDGNHYRSDYLEVQGDLKHALIENMQLRLKNHGTLKAAHGERRDHLAEFRDVSYSACEVCRDQPQSPLLWELHADKVIHDSDDKILKYYNSKLFFAGIPVFYMPYFYYPDPTVTRKQGFLLPEFGSDRNIGVFYSLPYFIPVGDHADVTINPIFTGNGGQLLSGGFRSRGVATKIDGNFSFTEATEVQGDLNNPRVEKNSDRWHVDIKGEIHHDSHWRSGFTLHRASDENYLRRYPFWGDPGNFIQSKIYVERFDRRDYINATAYSFQDLRIQDNVAEPRIYPNIDVTLNGDRDSYGGLWDFHGNMRFYDQSRVVEDRRLYGRTSYRLPYYSDSGFIAEAAFHLYGKAQSSDFDRPINTFGSRVSDENRADMLAQIGVDWRMPFYRSHGGGRQTIEPMVAVYIAENGINDRNLNNNDAGIFVLDSHNIMRPHRFNGVDRFDGGRRIAYGMRASHQADNYNIGGFLGQSYEFSEDDIIKQELGITEGASDIITSVLADSQFAFGHVYLDNQIAWDSASYELNRYFSQAALLNGDWNVHSNYLYTRKNQFSEEREQINFTIGRKLSKYWRGGVFATIDWGEPAVHASSRTRAYGTDFIYDDECFNFKISAYRDFTNRPGVEDGYSVVATFDLKTLGGIGGQIGNTIRNLSGFTHD